jgi:predicted ester cyclase
MIFRTDNGALARRVFDEMWTQGNLDLADEIVAPEFVGRQSGMAPFHGPAGAKQVIGRLRTAFPDIAFTIEELVAEGDLVATRWTARGTNDGEFLGMAPSGRRVTLDGVTFQRFKAGRIIEGWTQADVLGLLEQITMSEPAPA